MDTERYFPYRSRSTFLACKNHVGPVSVQSKGLVKRELASSSAIGSTRADHYFMLAKGRIVGLHCVQLLLVVFGNSDNQERQGTLRSGSG